KCLEKDPQRRYRSAGALAEELRRYLAGEPLAARPVGNTARLWMWCRRRPVIAGLTTALVVVVLVGSAVSTWQAIAATRAEVRATREARRALEAEGQAQNERDRALAAEAQAKAEGQRAGRSAAEAQAVLSFFQDQVLAAARPEGQDGGLGKDLTLRQAVDAAEPIIAAAFPDQPGVEAAIRHTLGSSYSYLGQPASAIRQLRRALELRTAQLGPDHSDTLTTQHT